LLVADDYDDHKKYDDKKHDDKKYEDKKYDDDKKYEHHYPRTMGSSSGTGKLPVKFCPLLFISLVQAAGVDGAPIPLLLLLPPNHGAGAGADPSVAGVMNMEMIRVTTIKIIVSLLICAI